MSNNIYPYSLDLSGRDPNNRFVKEPHDLTDGNLLFCPRNGCFFSEPGYYELEYKGLVLQPDVDYVPLHLHADATKRTNKEVSSLIALRFVPEETVYFTYQAIGGEYLNYYHLIKDLVATLNVDTRKVHYNDIVDLPTAWTPTHHYHNIANDLYGADPIIFALNGLAEAIRQGDSAEHQYILSTIETIREAHHLLISRLESRLNEMEVVGIEKKLVIDSALNDRILNPGEEFFDLPSRESTSLTVWERINKEITKVKGHLTPGVARIDLGDALYEDIELNVGGALLYVGTEPHEYQIKQDEIGYFIELNMVPTANVHYTLSYRAPFNNTYADLDMSETNSDWVLRFAGTDYTIETNENSTTRIVFHTPSELQRQFRCRAAIVGEDIRSTYNRHGVSRLATPLQAQNGEGEGVITSEVLKTVLSLFKNDLKNQAIFNTTLVRLDLLSGESQIPIGTTEPNGLLVTVGGAVIYEGGREFDYTVTGDPQSGYVINLNTPVSTDLEAVVLRNVAFTETYALKDRYGLVRIATLSELLGDIGDGVVNTKVLNAYMSNILGVGSTFLSTFDEISTALGDDPNLATSILSSLGERATKSELNNIKKELQDEMFFRNIRGY